jgi:hypothetical protein
MFNQPMNTRDRFEDALFVPRTNAQITVLVDIKPDGLGFRIRKVMGEKNKPKWELSSTSAGAATSFG